jgi:hypothetical protein
LVINTRNNFTDKGGTMANAHWTWANLTDVQRQQVAEAESTLGADYLLVYQSDQPQSSQPAGSFPMELQVAALTPSQVECLQGLENQLQAVVVAYRKG